MDFSGGLFRAFREGGCSKIFRFTSLALLCLAACSLAHAAAAQTNGISSSAAGTTGLWASGTEYVYVGSTGNVGIGTTSPQYPLDVNGVARAGTFNIGYENHSCCTQVSSSAAAGNFASDATLGCSAGKKIIYFQCYTPGGGGLPNGTQCIGSIDSSGTGVQCFNCGSSATPLWVGDYLCANVE